MAPNLPRLFTAELTDSFIELGSACRLLEVPGRFLASGTGVCCGMFPACFGAVPPARLPSSCLLCWGGGGGTFPFVCVFSDLCSGRVSCVCKGIPVCSVRVLPPVQREPRGGSQGCGGFSVGRTVAHGCLPPHTPSTRGASSPVYRVDQSRTLASTDTLKFCPIWSQWRRSLPLFSQAGKWGSEEDANWLESRL